MTANKSHKPAHQHVNLDWQDDCACTPNDAALMTCSTKLEAEVVNQLTAICRRCPVITQCAAEGLRQKWVGVYAGVYVPRKGQQRDHAITQLKRKAGAA